MIVKWLHDLRRHIDTGCIKLIVLSLLHLQIPLLLHLFDHFLASLSQLLFVVLEDLHDSFAARCFHLEPLGPGLFPHELVVLA